MRLLICAGGTGGGVYPALAVLQALRNSTPDPLNPAAESSLSAPGVSDLVWVGGAGGMEVDLVQQAGVPFKAIQAAGLHGVGLRAVPNNLGQLARGVATARRILREFQPDVIFFTGGFVAGPVAMAARLPLGGYKRPQLAIYVPDIEPGQALKGLGVVADRIAVTTEASRAYFSNPGRTVVTGYPTRPDLKRWERADALQALGLDDDLPVLFVWGGSRGSRSINRALLACLPGLLPLVQIIHISGSLDWPDVKKAQAALSLPDEQMQRYHPFAYLHAEMGAALACADLVVSRAGASCLGEFPLFGLPAILVPYPYAWRYQRVNAAYLEERGAAVVVEDERLADELTPLVAGLLGDVEKLQAMRSAMLALARPRAAFDIANVLLDLAHKGSRGAL